MDAQQSPQLIRHRYRWSCQIIYRHYTEFMELQREGRNLGQERGWQHPTFWIATAGNLNDFYFEREYDSLDQLAKELEARENDIDFMKLMRKTYEYVVQGSVKVELFENAIER
jgi:hypothetical protein